MLQQAQDNLADSGRHLKFEIVDAQSIPYDDESFDVVIANHMLYHVPDKAKALGEIRRVLKAGGHVYASTVGLGHMRELYQIIDRFDPDKEFHHAVPSFTLDNGREQLLPWFSRIALHRYEDSLVITETELLVAYILSLADAGSVFVEIKLAELVEYVEQEIATHGAIHIAKDSGMFEAF
jgi:SAM-dependent methyltransferase